MATARALRRIAAGIAALAVVFGSSSDVASAQDGVEVRVMSFNVRTSYAYEDAKSTCSNWDGVRKENAANQIRTVAPDFVGTQETSEPQKAFLDGALAANTYKAIGRYSGSLNGKAGEVNAIYYKSSVWTSLGDGMFWLGPDQNAMSAAWGMDYYRTAVWGRFQHIATGQTVCIFNTHYETPGKTEAQNQASGIILTRISTHCQATDKLTVLTGDLNAQPGDSAVKKLIDGGLAEPSGAATYCGDMISPGCATKFDYTLHKVKDGACYKSSDVLRTAFGGCYTSDHAPLLGTFCLGGSCCGVTPTPTTAAPSPTPSPGPSPSTTTNSTSAGSAATAQTSGSAANEANVIPGSVNAGTDAGAIGGEGNILKAAAPPAADAASGSSAATPSGSDSTTKITTSNSSSESGSSGTVMAVLGVVGAVGVVAVVVVRKKRALDSRLDGEKSLSAPMPSYFTRGNDAGNDDLSPLPRISEQSAFERQTNSPIPTLGNVGPLDNSRDSRSSSVSFKGASPGGQYSRESSNNFSVRMSSAVILDDSSTYSRSPSYDARMESRINFSEAYRADSFDSDDGGALTKSHADFAML